jgi:pimeloyl-ACP methyl ester carboxylesterase
MPHHEATGIDWNEHGAGLPVVMLHGLVGDRRLISRFTESVLGARPGLRRLHLDLPGHGLSSGAGVSSSDDVVDRVARFLDDVLAGEPHALVGNSFGGGVSRALLARDPSRILGMALIAPMIIADHARRDAPFHAPIDVETIDGAPPTTAATSPSSRSARRDGTGTSSSRTSCPAPASATRTRSPASPRPTSSRSGRSRGSTGPGRRLRRCVGERLVMPTRDLSRGGRAGHDPHHEQPELCAAALGAWIDAVLSSTDAGA